MHLLERGYGVRLLTDTGTLSPDPEGGGLSTGSSDTAGLLLDTLAVVEHSDAPGLSLAYDAVRAGNEGLLIAFLGSLDEAQTAVTARMRQRASGAVAFTPLGQQPQEAEQERERVRMLRESGWTIVPYTPGDPLPELWRQADRPTTAANAWGGQP
jgi:hypothetical protein